jgi:hypothetical protein
MGANMCAKREGVASGLGEQILFGLDLEVAAALATAVVTLLVFFSGRIFAFFAGRRRTREHQNAVVSAIFTEVIHNVEDLNESLRGEIPQDKLREHFENKPSGTMLIVYSRNMSCYEQLRTELAVLNTDLLDKVVRFYSHLEKVYRYCDSVGGEVFKEISLAGKLSVCTKLRDSEREAIEAGKAAIDAFRREYGPSVLGYDNLRSPRVPDHAS